jgi:hypothetical protein
MTNNTNASEQEKSPQFTLNEDGTVTVILSVATVKMLNELDAYSKRSNPMVNEIMNIAEELAKENPSRAEKFAELKERTFGKVKYDRMVESTVKAVHAGLVLEGDLDGDLMDSLPEELRATMGMGTGVIGVIGGRAGGIGGLAKAMEAIAQAQINRNKMGDMKS